MNSVLLWLGVFGCAAAVVVSVFRGTLLSPIVWLSVVFASTGFFSIFPLMAASKTRYPETGEAAQWIFFLTGVVCCLSSAWSRRPVLSRPLRPMRWRFFGEKTWYGGFLLFCMLDVAYTVATFGTVGLIYGRDNMGIAGGGAHSGVFSTFTYLGWVAGSMAFFALVFDYFSSKLDLRAYIRSNGWKIVVVLLCVLLNSLSGNRFMFVFRFMTVFLLLAMCGRIRWWMPVGGAVVIVVFFVVVGNIRFGQVDVREQLEVRVDNPVLGYPIAWYVSYTEPILPNLDNFVEADRPVLLGASWLTSVMPGFVVDRLGVTRMNAIIFIGMNSLLAHRGQTFRTHYPDLILDFGLVLGTGLGLGVIAFGAYCYRRAFDSERWFLNYIIVAPLMLFIPFLNPLYQIVSLLPFARLFLLRIDVATAGGRRGGSFRFGANRRLRT